MHSDFISLRVPTIFCAKALLFSSAFAVGNRDKFRFMEHGISDDAEDSCASCVTSMREGEAGGWGWEV